MTKTERYDADPVGYDGLLAPVKINGKIDYPPEPGSEEEGWSNLKIVLFGAALFIGLLGWAILIHWISGR